MRIVLILGLLIVVAVVSLFQAYRHYDQINTAYESGEAKGNHQIGELSSEVDSLKLAMGEQQAAFGDSMIRKEASGQYRVDSLNREIDSRDSIIAAQKVKQKKETVKQVSAAVKPKDSKHEQILTYYKERCKNLPSDLSEYERKVAFAEIRSETARKFSISLTELNRIRNENHLSY